MEKAKLFDGVVRHAVTRSHYFHYEPGDGTRYEFVITLGTPAGDVLAMVCPYRRSMILPKSWDDGYIMEKLDLHGVSAEATAKAVGVFLCQFFDAEHNMTVIRRREPGAVLVQHLLAMYVSGRGAARIVQEFEEMLSGADLGSGKLPPTLSHHQLVRMTAALALKEE